MFEYKDSYTFPKILKKLFKITFYINIKNKF